MRKTALCSISKCVCLNIFATWSSSPSSTPRSPSRRWCGRESAAINPLLAHHFAQKKCIKLCVHLAKLRNYNHLGAVVAGLNSAHVQSMTSMWDDLPPSFRSQFDDHERLVSPMRNFGALREWYNGASFHRVHSPVCVSASNKFRPTSHAFRFLPSSSRVRSLGATSRTPPHPPPLPLPRAR